MDGHSRSSHKYLLLQVWCGLLTAAVVVMAVFLASIKLKVTEDGVSTMKPDNVSPTVNTMVAPLKSVGSSLSYIQLMKFLDNRFWQESPRCHSCSLSLRDDAIHCTKKSLYFIFAQVTFARHPNKNRTKSVILKRNGSRGRITRKLVEGTFPGTTEGSVWVGKIVSLGEGDSVSLEITEDFLNDSTFWGAYELL
ncbi:Tumor necrosis factor beta [Scophthalmus maximus]|uniref:Tumor necrosis factor beta n=2 Tax=Scophthalmus maximus TaxID=52904 RepID=A0A2U9AWX7_SCOMX|nr:Tumor necrosis factor beta [Scophthalmus maximus]